MVGVCRELHWCNYMGVVFVIGFWWRVAVGELSHILCQVVTVGGFIGGGGVLPI